MDNTKATFKTIQIIYGSLIFGIGVFFFYTMERVNSTRFDYNDGSLFPFIIPAIFIIAFLLSNYLFQKKITSMENSDSFFTKLTKYQFANIMRAAPFEAAGIIAIFSTELKQNLYYYIFAVLSILFMLYHFPTKAKFENVANLSMEDAVKLREI